MRAVWSAPAGQTYQGFNNTLSVYVNNTLKRALKTAQDDLFMFHQQEDAVNGGLSTTIQWHYLKIADTEPMTSSTVVGDDAVFDANDGATGSADTDFGRYLTRRDFQNTGRGF